jgi:hypothetical protein
MKMAADGNIPVQSEFENMTMPRATDLAKQILSSSGTMIGLCTTTIGLIKIIEGRIGPSNVDIFIALLGSMFLGSAIFSYASIRTAKLHNWSARLEAGADALFISGLVAIVTLILLFALEQI